MEPMPTPRCVARWPRTIRVKSSVHCYSTRPILPCPCTTRATPASLRSRWPPGRLTALCPLNSVEGSIDGALTVSDITTPLIAIADVGDPLGNLVMGAFEEQGIHPQSRITVQTYQLARSLVEAGAGMTVVDPFTAASADRTRVKVRALEPAIPVQLYLLTSTGSPPAQSARRLVKFLGDTARASLASVGV